MHAASVNPEPGSNSLKNYILNLPRGHPPRKLNTFFRANFNLSFLLLFELFSLCLTRIAQISLCSNFVLFNFQWSSAALRFRFLREVGLFIILQKNPVVKSFSKLFSIFFSFLLIGSFARFLWLFFVQNQHKVFCVRTFNDLFTRRSWLFWIWVL